MYALNIHNDQTYTMTATMSFATLGGAIMQGYSTNAGDLGKQHYFQYNVVRKFHLGSSNSQAFCRFDFYKHRRSGANHLLQIAVTGTFLRCVFHGARGAGLLYSGALSCYVIECEAYDDNKSNTANDGGFTTSGSSGTMICINCYSHDHASGTNANGYSSVSSPGSLVLINSIADTCAGSGVAWGLGAAAGTNLVSVNSNYYNNVDGIKITATSTGGFAYIANNNSRRTAGKL